MKEKKKPLGRHLCRVCGHESAGFPWGADGENPSFGICACCGVEFGNDDSTPMGVRRARERWMKSGYAWFAPEMKPPHWSPDTQMSRLKQTLWDPWA